MPFLDNLGTALLSYVTVVYQKFWYTIRVRE